MKADMQEAKMLCDSEIQSWVDYSQILHILQTNNPDCQKNN